MIFENRTQYDHQLKKLSLNEIFVQKVKGSKTEIGSVGQRINNFDPISSGKRCGALFNFLVKWSIFWSKSFWPSKFHSTKNHQKCPKSSQNPRS